MFLASTGSERWCTDAFRVFFSSRALRSLEYERHLINTDSHPLYLAAIQDFHQIRKEKQRFQRALHKSKLATSAIIYESQLVMNWDIWQNEKMEDWYEIYMDIIGRVKKSTLESSDNLYCALRFLEYVCEDLGN